MASASTACLYATVTSTSTDSWAVARGVADGRAGFTLAGRTFAGNSHYRRAGLTPVVYIEGDTSGYVAGLARVLVGPADIAPLAEQCGSEGISQAEVVIETFSAPLSIASPQQ